MRMVKGKITTICIKQIFDPNYFSSPLDPDISLVEY